MATAAKTSIRVPAQSDVQTSYPEGSIRFDWLMTALSALFLAGLWVDGWAHFHGEVDGNFFTPWHFLFYSSFAIVSLFLGINQLRNVGRGYSFTRALPKGYWLSLIGVAVFALGGVGDMIWHTLFGIEAGTEALMSPTHLMLAVGMALIFTGPVRSAWIRARSSEKAERGWRALGPLIAAMTLFVTLLMFFTSYANPMITPYIFMSLEPETDLVQTDQLYIMNADGTRQTRLTNTATEETSWASWSPDGETIVFTSGAALEPAEGEAVDPQTDLYTMRADGSGTTRLTTMPGREWSAVWSPDGTSLAFINSLDDQQDIYMLDMNGGAPVRLTTTPDIHETSLAWSPDGSQLAYGIVQNETTTIWLMNADGTNARALTTDNADDPAWSPNGSRIAFHSFRDNSTGIYSMNADGGDVQMVINTGAFEVHPTYTPDGEYILFTSWASGTGDIYRIPASGGETEPMNLTNNPALWSRFASVSPDGSQILYAGRGQTGENSGSSNNLLQDFGVTSILLTGALYASAVALLLWQWRVPFGTFTLLFTLSTALFTILNDVYFFIIPGLVTGLVVDVLVNRLHPSPERIGRYILLTFIAPMVYFSLYFLVVGVVVPLPWSIHVWTGAIIVAGMFGMLIALLISASAREKRAFAAGN